MDLARKPKKLCNVKVMVLTMVPLEHFPKAWKRDWGNGRSEEECRLFRLHNPKESRISAEACCHSNFNEKLPLWAGVKNWQICQSKKDKTQQNSKCRLYGDWEETINHIISKCSKLAQREYKTRHDWVGKVIHWELCKKFKFDHTSK